MHDRELEEYYELPPVVTGRPEAYPWDEWCDGRVHKITEADGYDKQTLSNIRFLAYRAAERRGLRATTRTDKAGNVYIQAKLSTQIDRKRGENDSKNDETEKEEAGSRREESARKNPWLL